MDIFGILWLTEHLTEADQYKFMLGQIAIIVVGLFILSKSTKRKRK